MCSQVSCTVTPLIRCAAKYICTTTTLIYICCLSKLVPFFCFTTSQKRAVLCIHLRSIDNWPFSYRLSTETFNNLIHGQILRLRQLTMLTFSCLPLPLSSFYYKLYLNFLTLFPLQSAYINFVCYLLTREYLISNSLPYHKSYLWVGIFLFMVLYSLSSKLDPITDLRTACWPGYAS